jgi:hypothetical protein
MVLLILMNIMGKCKCAAAMGAHEIKTLAAIQTAQASAGGVFRLRIDWPAVVLLRVIDGKIFKVSRSRGDQESASCVSRVAGRIVLGITARDPAASCSSGYPRAGISRP